MHVDSHKHGHKHEQNHETEHDTHMHNHEHTPDDAPKGQRHAHGNILTIRAQSGLSGDMLLAGMAQMSGCTQAELHELLALLDMPELLDSVTLVPRAVHGISGVGCTVQVPHEHCHRSHADIVTIIQRSRLDDRAKELALKTFALLAAAEGAVHGLDADAVCFHEVGALDSILDICLVCALFVRLNQTPCQLICSPLPLGDGGVYCAHGWIPAPAPAVLRLLEGVKVCAFGAAGETVTPTAIALLKALGAHFGAWPSMRVERTALVYGTKIFENVPNGSIWAWGQATGIES